MDEERSTTALVEAIEGLPVTDEPVRSDVDSFWVDCVRGSLRGWATELRRDVRRIGRGLAQAATTAGSAPDDEQIAALEEVLWRLHSAVEKVDAIIAIAFGTGGIRLYDSRARSLRFDPSEESNTTRLRDLGTPAALRLREVRNRLEGERAILRRHQLAHSLVPLVDLHDLACYILVHHRDGRIIVGGYELGRLGPERWDEGVRELRADVLFARRLEEATRAHQALLELLCALTDALRADARIEVPPLVYRDEDTAELALERPEPKAPVLHVEVEFVFGADRSGERRVVSCTYKMQAGIEIDFDHGRWRVIRVEDGDGDPIDQYAFCIRVGEAAA